MIKWKYNSYRLVRYSDIPCHHAAHSSHVPSRHASRVLQVSQGGGVLFRERLTAMPVQDVVAGICFTQLVHLPQEIALLLFQYRDLHLQEKKGRDCTREFR